MTRPGGSAVILGPRSRELIAVACVLVVCTLFVMSKRHNGFVYDDVRVVAAEFIHSPDRIGEVFFGPTMMAQGKTEATAMDTYRPIPLLTFFWDAWLSGHDPWSFHLTNHVLHLAVVLCVFALARVLLAPAGVWVAAVVALFFGLSPQLGEAHVWINGRSDPLAALFGLLAILVWTGWDTSPKAISWRPWATFVLFLIGLLSKEVLLLGLPSLLFWPTHRDRTLLWRIGRAVPFVVAAGVYFYLRTSALHGLHASQGSEQIVAALKHIPVLWIDGLAELLVPSRLYFRSMRDEYALLSSGQHLGLLALVILIAFAVWMFRRRAPVLVWASLWFAGTLAPVAMVSVLLYPGFGRYLYLPCVGLSLALGDGLARASAGLGRYFAEDATKGARAEALLRVIVCVYLLSLGARLAVVTEDYADNRTLYSAAILAAPRPAYAHGWLGVHYVETRDLGRAIAALRKASELDPSEPIYQHELGRALLRSGDALGAETMLRGAIARAPKEKVGNLRALLVYSLAGRDAKSAVAELCTCLAYQPELDDCTSAVGALLDPRGPNFLQLREAIILAQESHPSDLVRAALARLVSQQERSGKSR